MKAKFVDSSSIHKEKMYEFLPCTSNWVTVTSKKHSFLLVILV